MSILADIETLEERVQALIASASDLPTINDFKTAYVELILSELTQFSSADLNDDRLSRIVSAALAENIDLIDSILADEIEQLIEEVVDTTTAFYAGQGIAFTNIYEAVQRKKTATELARRMVENMGEMREELFNKTLEVMQEQLLTGTLNRQVLTDSLLDAAEGKLIWARTNSRMVVGGYNRVARDVVAEEADLNYALYYGQKRDNTRTFCINCIGKVFDRSQISALSNGQGLDVITYAGGWNCIHSWLWVELDWDASFQSAYDATRAVATIQDNSLTLKVYQ